MATLMAGHRRMEESKQVRDNPPTKQVLKLHQGRAQGGDQASLAAIARDIHLGLVLADVVHEGGVNPRHGRGDGFPGVVGRPIASPTNLDLQASGCRGVRTLGQDLTV